MTEMQTTTEVVTGKCVKCSRWGNAPGDGDTVRWKLCDFPSPAIELPIREFEPVAGRIEMRIVGSRAAGRWQLDAHCDFSCDEFLAIAKPSRGAGAAW